jgi:hypothetical protein
MKLKLTMLQIYTDKQNFYIKIESNNDYNKVKNSIKAMKSPILELDVCFSCSIIVQDSRKNQARKHV